MQIVQIVLVVILFFALTRVWLRFKGGQISSLASLFWTAVFSIALVGVLLPNLMTQIARTLGIGRGVDLIVYFSIAILFYLVFRAYVLMENIRHEITELVRKIALEKGK